MTHLSKQGIAALTRVAEWLEAGAPHVVVDEDKNLEIGFFDMEYAVCSNLKMESGDCGTACCIAGAVCQFEMLGMDQRDENGDLEWHTLDTIEFDSGEKSGAFFLAAKYLGMNYDDASAMFVPFHVEFLKECEYNNPLVAARVVRNFIDTSEVDWCEAAEQVYAESK